MKIISHCPVCNTMDESYHDWDSLEQFYAAELDEPEFAHDEGNRSCGGSAEYSIAGFGKPWETNHAFGQCENL